MPEVYKQKRIRKYDPEDYKVEKLPAFKCPGGQLRDYQWEAVRWMVFNWAAGKGSILADEVGRWGSGFRGSRGEGSWGLSFECTAAASHSCR